MAGSFLILQGQGILFGYDAQRTRVLQLEQVGDALPRRALGDALAQLLEESGLFFPSTASAAITDEEPRTCSP